MQTLIANSNIKTRKDKSSIPVTSRGRALYTTDWFLNGKPAITNHDNPRITLRNGMPC